MIIKNNAIVDDDWHVLRTADTEALVPAGCVIVPLAIWLAQRDTLMKRERLGVWLASSDRPEVLRDDIDKFSVIAVDFPKFADGRGYTLAYLLRERLGYKAELRAIGDVLRDQLFYMQRTGFNAFAVREDKDINEALKGLSDFSQSYQASVDQPLPLFRRVNREGVKL